jgi:hypothetical protein
MLYLIHPIANALGSSGKGEVFLSGRTQSVG